VTLLREGRKTTCPQLFVYFAPSVDEVLYMVGETVE
jgi:hypothetical protein